MERNYKWVDVRGLGAFAMLSFSISGFGYNVFILRQLASDRKGFADYLTAPFIVVYVTFQLLFIAVYLSVGNEGIKETI